MVEYNMLSKKDLLSLVGNAKALASELDLSDLLQQLLERAGKLTDSPSGSVILYDEVSDGLYFAAATGPGGQAALQKFGEFGPERIPIRGSKAGRVYLTRKHLVEHSLASDPDHFRGVDKETNYSTEGLVCVPLSFGRECLGVIQLLNKRSGNYTKRDVLLLAQFASHAAVAIRNAQLVRELLAHKGLFSSAVGGRKIPDLLRELSAPAHEERVSVLFADMRGFTRLCQILGAPAAIEENLNEFLTILADQVLAYGGLINKFLGDGVMALMRGEMTEIRAIRSAFAILTTFAELRGRWNEKRSEDLAFLDVGIGIATGEVLIGSIGGGRVKDFTALGNVVNVAAALEGAARAGMRILVDQSTYNSIKGIVAVGGVESFELRKGDQKSGVAHKRYHISRLRSDDVVASNGSEEYYDCFVSYASEDVQTVMRVVKALEERSVVVWWDRGQITLGDQLSKMIEYGLSKSRYGLVIISPAFLAKGWTDIELRTLVNRAISSGRKVILPVLVGMDRRTFANSYPLLADTVPTTFSGDVSKLVDEIVGAMK